MCSWLGFETIFPQLPLLLCLHFCSRTPLSPPAIPSTTRNPSLQHSSLLPPSLAPSIPWGAAAWVAGGGRRRDLGAPSQEANRCSPSGVSQMADIKKSWGGQRKMKTSLRMSRPQSSAHFSPSFLIAPSQLFFFFFPSFLFELSASSAAVDHFLILLLLPHKVSAGWSQFRISNRAETLQQNNIFPQTQHTVTSVRHLSKVSTSESIYCLHSTVNNCPMCTTVCTTLPTSTHTHKHAPVPVP